MACSCFFLFRPVMLRKFDSGVMVIQNKSHSDEEVITFCLLSILKHIRFFFSCVFYVRFSGKRMFVVILLSYQWS